MSLSRYVASLAGALLLAIAPFATAQSPCFQDDGYNLPGACCVTPQINLPQFPGFTNLPTDAACFTNCMPTQIFNEKITLTPPGQIFCDVYVLNVSFTGLVNIAPSLVIMKYARTWEEIDPTGVNHRQVWRFLVNGDLSYIINTASTTPCPVPKTAMAGMPVHFIGSIDYARNCQNGQFSVAYNFTHLCGDFMHSTLSPNPIFPNPNPDHMYSFVGPSPFVFAPAAIPAGAVIADSTRSVNWNFTVNPLQWDCKTEVPIMNGQLQTVNQYCACFDPTNPWINAWSQQQLVFSYGCAGAINLFTLIPWAPLLPTGLSTFSIGRYVGPPAQYPSGEALSLYVGISQAADPCANNFPVHIVTGIGTVGGDTALVHTGFAPAPIVTTQFLDLEDVMVLIGGPPFITLGFGGLFLSPMLWSLNF